MSKVRDISGLANIIKTDANGNVTFVSGSTTLMAISSSGAVTSTGTIGGSNSSTLATTGSNIFTGQQYVSNTNAPVNFTDTASLYTDGGLRVGKDAYVSGTLYLNNLTVYGTQSVNYITSSQLDIADNIITVNTSTPQIRFGGIAVRDSGSEGTGLTGSLLWDSQNNHWVYTNPSGSSYSGGMLISGPRASSLGEEQGTTFNALMKGQGGDHITSSGIFEVSGNVGIGTSTVTEGTQAASSISIFPSSSVSSGPLIQFPGNGRIRPASTGDRLSIDGNALYLNNYIGGNIITNTAGGGVGIGASPVNLLSVRGNADFGSTGIAYAGMSQYGALTFPRGQIMWSNTNNQNQLYIVGNAYSNNNGVFAYRNSSQPATAIGLDNGGISFLTAGNGTADAAISWTSAIGITNAGYITTPSQPAFYAYGSGAGATSTTGNYIFNATRLNRGSHYNTGNGRFTAPVAGVYRFVFASLYRQKSGSGSGEISISINGSNINSRGIAYALATNSTDTHVPMTAELIYSLNAGDYVMPFIYSCGAGSDFYMDSNLSYFCGYLIG